MLTNFNRHLLLRCSQQPWFKQSYRNSPRQKPRPSPCRPPVAPSAAKLLLCTKLFGKGAGVLLWICYYTTWETQRRVAVFVVYQT